MRLVKHAFFLLLLLYYIAPIYGQKTALYTPQDSTVRQKHPFKAAAEVFSLNMGIWAFDRFVTKGDFAYISANTIKNNIKTGFVWDNDGFSTNLFAHPYHGSLYYSLARYNNMSFLESAPYALSGSLMWELCMENEPPSINDLLSTTFGGVALGETFFRLTPVILNDSKTGVERVFREIGGAIFSPMLALKRVSNGDMFVTRGKDSYRSSQLCEVTISSGSRYLSNQRKWLAGGLNGFAAFDLKYGDPFEQESYKPYDYFSFNGVLNLIGSGQPLIGSINSIGILYGKTFSPFPKQEMTLGVFQHYDYYRTNSLSDSEVKPFEISQSAAFGVGLLHRLPETFHQISIEYNVHLNAILMGGVVSDHYTVVDRDYNLGSGYGSELFFKIDYKKRFSFSLGLDYFRLYTWKGYPNEPAPIPITQNMTHLNAQGNKGDTSFAILNPKLMIQMTPRFAFNINPHLYFRNSHYDKFEDVNYKTFESRLSVSYLLE